MDDPVAVSPDGQRFVTRLVRGDVARNGLWLEILTGELASLKTAARAKVVARLFGKGLGSGDYIVGPDADTLRGPLSPLHWIDNANIALIWSDAKGCRQVMQVNLIDGRIEQLTHSESQIAGFAIRPGGTLIYNAQVRVAKSRFADLTRDGLAVPGDIDGLEVLQDEVNLNTSGLDEAYNSQWFITVDGSPARRLVIAHQEVDRAFPSSRTTLLSPDGRQAVLAFPPEELSSEWQRYTYEAQPFMKNVVSAMLHDRRSVNARRAIQLYVVDLQRGTSRLLWPALLPVGVMLNDDNWSPDGRRLLIAPTFLPAPAADAAGLAGSAAAVVAVDSGRYDQLPIDLKGLRVESSRWVMNDLIAIDTLAESDTEPTRWLFRLTPNGWTLGEKAARIEGRFPAPIVIKVRQDLNTPPTLRATDRREGKESIIYDPNPRLTNEFSLGRVAKVDHALPGGLRYSALVFYPTKYRSGSRYPLVLQPMRGGIDSKEFTLYGWQDGGGLGPTLITTYAAQVFANRGMVTAFVDVAGQKDYAGEAKAKQLALDAFAEKMVAEGSVDRKKVGLNGFSRTGYYVAYTATHSRFPYAAALTDDNIDGSYLQAAASGWDEGYDVNGGPAFGATLENWIAEAPAFNAESVRMPMALVSQSSGSRSGIWMHWEMFSRLRHLQRPVEIYLMPGIDTHPAHCPQNPRQILAVQQYAVDWFDFWLNGREQQGAEKSEQYARWSRMKKEWDSIVRH